MDLHKFNFVEVRAEIFADEGLDAEYCLVCGCPEVMESECEA
jgi:hypothetical protein